MSKHVLAAAVAALAVGALALSPVAMARQNHHGDTLLMHRVQAERGMHLPARGMTKAAVIKQYGQPLRKLAPRGGDTPRHPVIYRWEYSKYIVYFEHDHVIHSVLNTPAGNNRHPKTAG
ncbi:MAG TPA: hypothetical protein VF271_01320 [Rhodanobacteraceae bacterium]